MGRRSITGARLGRADRPGRNSALTGPIEAGPHRQRVATRQNPIRPARPAPRSGRPHPRRRRTAAVPEGGAQHSDDAFQEGQERQVQRVIAAAHPFVLAVGGKEELLQVVAADRDEIGQFEEGRGA
jgi:hypothetical protein